jgi:hypothetical protein
MIPRFSKAASLSVAGLAGGAVLLGAAVLFGAREAAANRYPLVSNQPHALSPGGTGYTALVPARLLDTRPGSATIDGLAAAGGRIGPGQTLNVKVTGRGGVPAAGVDAVVLNVTAVDQTTNTFLTVFPAGSARPGTSNLNPAPGIVATNAVIAKVGTNGEISIYNDVGFVHVLVDVHGWFPAGSAYASLLPSRVMDTRPGTSTTDGLAQGGGVIPAGGTVNLTVTGRGGVPATGVGSVVLNITPAGPTLPSFITVYPAGSPRPNSSNLSLTPGLIAPNMVVAKVGTNGQVSIYNDSGDVHMLVDVEGWFPVGPTFTALDPARLLDTRPGVATVDGVGAGGGELGPAGVLHLQVTGRAGVPPTGVGAVVLNVTGVNQSQDTFLTAYPNGTARPNASVLNPTKGIVSTNLVIVKVGANGQVSIYNNTGSLDLIADISGWFPSDVVAGPDTATVVEDAAATAIDVLANDTDADGGPLTIASTSQPAHGIAVLTGGTSGASVGVNYTPTSNYCGGDSFVYTLNGGFAATVSITVTCFDDAPVAVADAATVVEDSAAAAVDVLANDTDVDGGPKSITSVTQPANGAVVITGGGAGLTYAPNANYCTTATTDTFTYTVAPGGSSTSVAMTITCVDDSPVAINDAATVVENSGANAVPVLANDTDVDGGPKSVASVTQPANGAVVITGGGTGLTYAPNTNYCNNPPGTTLDTFNYTLAPGASTATVTTTVTCVDDAPVAVADAATVVEDSGATAVDVLANDTDTDGGPKGITSVTQPANGTVVLTGGGTGLTYAPNTNYCNNPPGTTLDTFTYTLTPGGSSGTVTMTVTCVDDNPVAVAESATVVEDAAATAVDVLANDTDVDGGPKGVASVTQPANGTVVITGGGTGLTYAPNANYCNTTTPDTFTYTLTPGTSTATVTITVTCVDDTPVAVADPATVVEDSGANAIDVLANDTDVDLGPKSVASVTQPSNGAVVITGGGTGLTYTPNANYCNNPPGTTLDTFTYTLTPGASSTTVTVTVTCVDDAPVAVADAATATEDTAAPVDVLANDTDIDGGPKSVTSITQPTNGTVAITGGGTGLTYTPNADYCNDPPGTTLDTFTYTLAPGGSSTTVTLTVTCVNDAPVAADMSFTGTNQAIGNTALVVNSPGDGAPDPAGPQKTVTGDILAGDTDVDGPGPLVIVAGTLPSNGGGSVVLESDGDFTFFPAPATSCTVHSDFFDYTVTDQNPGVPGTDVGRVTIAIQDCVWYVNAGAPGGGDGRSQAPFNALASVSSGIDPDLPGQKLFLYAGTYAGGLTLENTQTLVSQRHGLAVPDGGAGTVNLVAASGANSVIAGGLTLATDNTVQGIDLGDAAGAALSGTTVGTATIDTVTTGLINNTVGGAVSITGGTVNATFTTVSSSGGVNGIALTNVAGTFTASGGAITNATAADVSLSGGSSAFTYNGTISDDLGPLVAIAGETGGVKDFNGSITDLDNGTGNGISMTSSTGATVRFDGGLTLATGGSPAFTATGGGTVSVTGVNSIATTTGIGLNVANTTIGSSGLTFLKISADGAPNGIILNNTGIAGFLTIPGNNGACTSAVTCTGGAIQNTSGVGISLNSTADVSIAHMYLANTGDQGVKATAMRDGAGSANPTFSLLDSRVFSAGNADNENALDFGTDASPGNNTGRIVITDTIVSQYEEQGLSVHNDSPGSSLVVDVTGTPTGVIDSTTKFDDNNDTYGQGGILVLADSTTTITLNVTGVMFNNIETDAVMAQSRTSASFVHVNLTNNISLNGGGPDTFPAGGGFTVISAQGGGYDFNINNNNLRNISGDGVVIVADGDVQGRIDNNVISGTGGDGIRIDTDDRTDPLSGNNFTVTIEALNNTLGADATYPNIGDDGIQVLHRDGTKTLNLTIAGNTVANTSVVNTGEAIRYFQDADVSDSSAQPYANVRIVNNAFTNVGTADALVFILQETADIDLNVSANTFTGVNNNISLTRLGASMLQISQSSVPALASSNTNAAASSTGAITFNSPAPIPPVPTNP